MRANTPDMENKPCPVVPVAILVRVSTKRQETERQVHELHAVAAARGWQVVEVIEEDGVSGAARDADRHGLARVEALAAAGAIRKVLVHEVSRVGRRPAVVHGFVERLLEVIRESRLNSAPAIRSTSGRGTCCSRSGGDP